MGGKKKMTFWFFLFLGSTIITASLHSIHPQIYGLELLRSILFVVTVIVGFFFFLKIMEPEPGAMISDEEKQVSKREKKRKGEVSVSKADTSGSQRGFFGNLFKKEKVCDECGTELEYREEFKSYYCPECHTYK
ncbi:MAG: hypothetical protein V5A88_06940 [Candidatus Thermoplasmatota archaeon]